MPALDNEMAFDRCDVDMTFRELLAIDCAKLAGSGPDWVRMASSAERNWLER